MSKLLANQIANYNDNGPVEAKEGLNFPTSKPLQVAGSAGISGQYLRSTGNGLAWETFPTIPAAQVQVDWNATTGITSIANKPNLAVVATSGSYNDLSDRPAIAPAQVNADWNETDSGEKSFILNKPTLFSGSWIDLSDKPTVPSTLTDLQDVDLPGTISDGTYIQWNAAASRWQASTGAAGLNSIVEDNNPQLGGDLDAQGRSISGTGGTIEMSGQSSKLRFHYDALNNLPDPATWHGMFAHVHATGKAYYAHSAQWVELANITDIPADTDTTYTIDAEALTQGARIKLTSSAGSVDDITIEAGSNITIDQVTPANIRINSTGGGTGGGATVTTADVAPTSPVDGDLWWKSDEGRLKVYYADGDSNQWIDASPPLAPTNITLNSSTVGIGNITAGPYYSASNPPQNSIILTPASGNHIKLDGNTEMGGHIIPSSNADYDLGSAEYKIRHLFLSDNSLWVGDQHKIDIDPQGAFKVKKRKKRDGFVPKSVVTLLLDAALIASASDAPTHALNWFNANYYPGNAQAADLSGVTLQMWYLYAQAISGFDAAVYPEASSLFPAYGTAGYDDADYEEITRVGQEGLKVNPVVAGSDIINVDIRSDGPTAIMYDPIGDFQVIIGESNFETGATFACDLHVKQSGATARTISSLLIKNFNGDSIAAGQLRVIGTPTSSVVNTFMVRGVYLDGSWKVNVQIV
jgi:hypothetical protein